VRVDDRQSFLRYRDYIAQNPVKAGLLDLPEEFPYGFTYWQNERRQGLKAR
jgi:hypothetical protein